VQDSEFSWPVVQGTMVRIGHFLYPFCGSIAYVHGIKAAMAS